MQIETVGRKVFFLYPHSVITDNLIYAMIENEFEVYTVKDHIKLKDNLKNYPGCIIFVNIDTNLTIDGWVSWITNVLNDTSLEDIRIGILTYNDNKDLAKTFLMDLGVQCGFIHLKLGVKESMDIILKTLEANEAKGKRKFVRADCKNIEAAGFNVNIRNHVQKGIITDISIAGMACKFLENVELEKNTLLKDIQLKLKVSVSTVTGVVIGTKELKDSKEYIIIFVKPTSATIERIHKFIHLTLQSNISRELGI